MIGVLVKDDDWCNLGSLALRGPMAAVRNSEICRHPCSLAWRIHSGY